MVDIIEGYETEEQQVDAIKKWWHENGTAFILCVVIGLGGLWGWRYYNDSVISSQEKASSEFSQTLVKFELDSSEDGAKEMQTFIDNNKGNNYATLAGLLLAKESVANKNFELAKTQLSALLKDNSYEPLNPVIKLRLARVEGELGEYDAALALLDKVTEQGFVAEAQQAKGNIYLKQGDLDAARSAFEAALAASEARVDPILQLQLDDLAVAKTEVSEPVLETAQ